MLSRGLLLKVGVELMKEGNNNSDCKSFKLHCRSKRVGDVDLAGVVNLSWVGWVIKGLTSIRTQSYRSLTTEVSHSNLLSGAHC